jgi:8-oxo-dGTP diphosphatase
MREIYVALNALIIIYGKFLIIKISSKEDVYKNEWDLPGGKLKFGENPVNGLKREVFEETDLNIKIVKPISVWTFFKNSGKTQAIGITFLAKVISGKIRLGKEHTDFKWILPEEINKYKIHEEIKKLIKSLRNNDSITF